MCTKPNKVFDGKNEQIWFLQIMTINVKKIINNESNRWGIKFKRKKKLIKGHSYKTWRSATFYIFVSNAFFPLYFTFLA